MMKQNKKMGESKTKKSDEAAGGNRTADRSTSADRMTWKQIGFMAKLELCNLFGWNVFRHTKDKAEKRKTILMAAAWILLIGIAACSVGGLVYTLFLADMEQAVPAFLILISSMIVLVFGIFKAGGVIFGRNGYDMLCALPVSQYAIVLGRMIRMYVENLAFILLIMVPGLAVYAWCKRPDFLFYPIAVLVTLLIPLLPLSGAVFFGVLVTAVASRMRHKSILSATLSIVLVLGILIFSYRFSMLDENMIWELLKGISAFALQMIGTWYPPAIWFGQALTDGNVLYALLGMILSILIFVLTTVIVSRKFHSISRMLYGTYAKHDYKMKSLKANPVLWALCRREFKRYFASSIYVTNTIIGPIMGTLFCAGLFVLNRKWISGINLDMILAYLPFEMDLCAMSALIISGMLCMMTTASVAVSMEGKEWWIAKTLPLSTKMILDAKLLMYLILLAPFYLISELLLFLTIQPDVEGMLTLLILPALFVLFSGVFGIAVNLRFPVLNWENDVYVVKQSMAAMLGGLGGLLLAVLCAVILFFIPGEIAGIAKIVMGIVLFVLTGILYNKNNRKNLKEI